MLSAFTTGTLQPVTALDMCLFDTTEEDVYEFVKKLKEPDSLPHDYDEIKKCQSPDIQDINCYFKNSLRLKTTFLIIPAQGTNSLMQNRDGSVKTTG